MRRSDCIDEPEVAAAKSRAARRAGIPDHPLIRALHTCPFCDGPKNAGLVACWPCHHAGRTEREAHWLDAVEEIARAEVLTLNGQVSP